MPEPLNETPNKKCLECGEPLGAGREDRKYCGDLCKTAFNNRRRKEPLIRSERDEQQKEIDRDHAAMHRVLDIIRHNRSILYNIFDLYERQVGYLDFLGHGINIKYFTSKYLHDDGYYYQMCFDYGYRIDGERVYMIYNGGELHFN